MIETLLVAVLMLDIRYVGEACPDKAEIYWSDRSKAAYVTKLSLCGKQTHSVLSRDNKWAFIVYYQNNKIVAKRKVVLKDVMKKKKVEGK